MSLGVTPLSEIEDCPASRTEGGYIDQCRPFNSFSGHNLEICSEHLSENGVYYLVDSPWMDMRPYSRLSLIEAIVAPVLPLECTQNLMSLLCNTWFKQCSQVEDVVTRDQIWLPSLMCRDACDEYLAVWDQCINTIRQDGDAWEALATQLAITADQAGEVANKDRDHDPVPLGPGKWNSFEPLRCDVRGGSLETIEPGNAVNAWWFGQYPVGCCALVCLLSCLLFQCLI
jgi:hypothetical protein